MSCSDKTKLKITDHDDLEFYLGAFKRTCFNITGCYHLMTLKCHVTVEGSGWLCSAVFKHS